MVNEKSSNFDSTADNFLFPFHMWSVRIPARIQIQSRYEMN